MWLRFAARQLARILLITLAAGFLGAALVRFSPGFDTDERDLDARLSAASHEADARARAGERNVVAFYGHWLSAALHGDFGTSRTMHRPVATLIAERYAVTLRMIAAGGFAGLLAGLIGAIVAAWRRTAWVDNLLSPANGALLSAPPAVVALIFLWLNLDPALAIAIAVGPYVFRYAHNLLREAAASPHVLTARARGLRESRICLAHVLLPALPQLAAVIGIAATAAVGAVIPVEVICDRPGLGQLAWQAALSRDMQALVAITVMITVVIVGLNSISEAALAARPERAGV